METKTFISRLKETPKARLIVAILVAVAVIAGGAFYYTSKVMASGNPPSLESGMNLQGLIETGKYKFATWEPSDIAEFNKVKEDAIIMNKKPNKLKQGVNYLFADQDLTFKEVFHRVDPVAGTMVVAKYDAEKEKFLIYPKTNYYNASATIEVDLDEKIKKGEGFIVVIEKKSDGYGLYSGEFLDKVTGIKVCDAKKGWTLFGLGNKKAIKEYMEGCMHDVESIWIETTAENKFKKIYKKGAPDEENFKTEVLPRALVWVKFNTRTEIRMEQRDGALPPAIDEAADRREAARQAIEDASALRAQEERENALLEARKQERELAQQAEAEEAERLRAEEEKTKEALEALENEGADLNERLGEAETDPVQEARDKALEEKAAKEAAEAALQEAELAAKELAQQEVVASQESLLASLRALPDCEIDTVQNNKPNLKPQNVTLSTNEYSNRYEFELSWSAPAITAEALESVNSSQMKVKAYKTFQCMGYNDNGTAIMKFIAEKNTRPIFTKEGFELDTTQYPAEVVSVFFLKAIYANDEESFPVIKYFPEQ